jgi:hypothetical protein
LGGHARRMLKEKSPRGRVGGGARERANFQEPTHTVLWEGDSEDGSIPVIVLSSQVSS